MFVSGVRVQLVQAGQRLDSESQHEVPRARSALLKSVVSYRAPTMTLPVRNIDYLRLFQVVLNHLRLFVDYLRIICSGSFDSY